jgi:hypothetical protein
MKGEMLRALAALSLLLAACPAAAIERKPTVYLDRLAGLERHLRSALDEADVWVSILDESIQPDFRIFLDAKFPSLHAELIYRNTTGRLDNAVLELFDSRSRKSVVRYSFKWSEDEDGQRQAARQFVELIRKRLNLKIEAASATLSPRLAAPPAGLR